MDFGNNNSSVLKYSCRKNTGIRQAQNPVSLQFNIHNFNEIAYNDLNSDLSVVNKLIFMLIFMGVE